MNKKITASVSGVLAIIIGIAIAFVTSPSDDTDVNVSSSPEVTAAVSAAEESSSEPPQTETETAAAAEIVTETVTAASTEQEYVSYKFRSKKLLDQHYKKHGEEMGFASAEEYEAAASDVINSPDALFKLEAEDGDGVYYIEATNLVVILSTDGCIRTYFNPSGGKAYFDKQ